MIYPILLKKILNRIGIYFEDFLLNKSHVRKFDAYESWLTEYLNLSKEDKKNIITKFERSQTATIMYGMSKKDPMIFINQLGCFYIKPTTQFFYDSLEKLKKENNKDEYDDTMKATALEQTRDYYIRLQKEKKHGQTSSFKIKASTKE